MTRETCNRKNSNFILGSWFQLCKASKSCVLRVWVQNECASALLPAMVYNPQRTCFCRLGQPHFIKVGQNHQEFNIGRKLVDPVSDGMNILLEAGLRTDLCSIVLTNCLIFMNVGFSICEAETGAGEMTQKIRSLQPKHENHNSDLPHMKELEGQIWWLPVIWYPRGKQTSWTSQNCHTQGSAREPVSMNKVRATEKDTQC